MKKGIKITLKWTGRIILLFLIVLALDLTALAFPGIWFSHRADFDNFSVYSNDELDSEQHQAIDKLKIRLEKSPLYVENHRADIFLFDDQGTYSIFARMTMVPPAVPGFNLSIFHNIHISLPGLADRKMRNCGRFKHSAIDGDLSQCMAHEFMHEYIAERYGRLSQLRLPRWKIEGLCEYGSTIAFSRIDTVATLKKRLEFIKFRGIKDYAEEFYTWGLLVEYLAEVKGLSADKILDDSTVYDNVMADMNQWYMSGK